jgi:hypothetical protein
VQEGERVRLAPIDDLLTAVDAAQAAYDARVQEQGR